MPPAAASPQDAVVELQAVTSVADDARPALCNVSFTVLAGEMYALLGGHGAGKTTILDMVAGLVRPSTGIVRALGEIPSTAPLAVKRQLVFAGHNALYDALTPIENVGFFLTLLGGSPLPSRDRMVDVIRQIGVPDRHLDRPLGRSPRSVTIGVHLALTVLRRAKLLLLDDPTLGLDSRAASALQRSLRLVRQHGTTVLLATSDVILAGTVADRTGVLVHGALAVEHDRARWLDRTVVELYAEYVGRPLADESRAGGLDAP